MTTGQPVVCSATIGSGTNQHNSALNRNATRITISRRFSYPGQFQRWKYYSLIFASSSRAVLIYGLLQAGCVCNLPWLFYLQRVYVAASGPKLSVAVSVFQIRNLPDIISELFTFKYSIVLDTIIFGGIDAIMCMCPHLPPPLLSISIRPISVRSFRISPASCTQREYHA